MEIKRGQIWYADLSPIVGSEQGGARPVVVISNDIGNSKSPVIIVAPLTTKVSKKKLPTQVILENECGLIYDSMVMCEQIRVIDKQRLKGKEPLATITQSWIMNAINKAIKISLGV